MRPVTTRCPSFWDNLLNEYLELPKRFVNAQTEFVEQAAKSLSG
jgi:hypothetical protein